MTERPNTQNFDIAIEGMTCGSCAARVQKALEARPEVSQADVNFATGRARVTANSAVGVDDLAAAIDRIGYKLSGVEGPSDEGRRSVLDDNERHQRMWLIRVVAVAPAAVFMMITMLMGHDAMTNDALRWTMFGVAVPVQFWVGWPFLREALRRARRFTANMDTLISVGTLAAFGLSLIHI